jgi:hypothetical protein
VVNTRGRDEISAMSWGQFRELMTTEFVPDTEKYCKIPKGNCFGCGASDHFRDKCPKISSTGTGTSGSGSRGRAFVIGAQEAQQDPRVVTGTFLICDQPAFILFDSGADRSFVSDEFRTLISCTPSPLEPTFEIELADGQFLQATELLRDCTTSFDDHTFPIDLIPIRIGSFDVIIGMDWLENHRADIMCFEKSIRIPLPRGGPLIVKSNKAGKRLKIISCLKVREYVKKECQIFLAHLVKKDSEVSIADQPVVCEFADVFPEDLPGYLLVERSSFV